MSRERRFKLITRWSVATATAIALFWSVWYLINGSVPVMSAIQLTPDYVLNLPFGVSRWWDALIGPICSTLIILMVANEKINKGGHLIIGLAFALVFGMALGPVSGLVSGLAYGMISGLVLGLVVGLAARLASGLVIGLATGLVVGLNVGLIVGLVSGLVYGLISGLASGLVYGLTYGLASGLAALIRQLSRANIWKSMGDWFFAK